MANTWCVGRGPELAAVTKTKDGMVRRKVGIVLPCSEHGLPTAEGNEVPPRL